MKQNSFLFMTSWEDGIKLLSDSDKAKFIKLLFDYHNGKSIDMFLESSLLKMFWSTVEPTLKLNREKYLKKINMQKSHDEIASHIQNTFFKK
jgi:hypothetical protein